jgi:DNA repair exonuclease SbcCD ATPase subunit
MSDLGPTDRPPEKAIEAAVDETGVGREELLKRALVSLAEAEDIDIPDAKEVAAIRRDLDDLDADVDEKVADLRDRFVELYRDVESKAPADHTHEETTERLDEVAADASQAAADASQAAADATDATETAATVEASVEAAIDDLVDIDDRLARVESRTEGLDDLGPRVNDLESRMGGIDVEDVDDKLSRVASAIVRVRRRLEAAERDRADRERLDALTAAANRHGVRKANCTECGETVNLGLLTTPECPHCGRRFAELEPNPGFLGTSRLVTEAAPPLDGDVPDNEAADDDSRDVTARNDADERSR